MRIAVIDIGSNSIKLLVAESGKPFKTVYRTSIETRIGGGLGNGNGFAFPEHIIIKATDSINALVDTALAYSSLKIRIAATSAVRDAKNAEILQKSVFNKTGYILEILSGEDELRLISKGIACDPEVFSIPEFCFFDLGGGSLEIGHVRDGNLLQGKSFQLGAIRLLEMCISNPHGIISGEELSTASDAVASALNEENFSVPHVPLIGLGGVLSVSRHIFAQQNNKTFEEQPPWFETHSLEVLLDKLAGMTIEERIASTNIGTARADIMPVALAAVLRLAQLSRQTRILHSTYNLRYGIAAEMLT